MAMTGSKEMCCLCLSVSKVPYTDMFSKNGNGLTYFHKISSSLYHLANILNKLSCSGYLICNKCCDTVDMICSFNSTCLKNIRAYSSLIIESNDPQRGESDVIVSVKSEIIYNTPSDDDVSEKSKVFEEVIVKQEMKDVSNSIKSYYELESLTETEEDYLDQFEVVLLENETELAISEDNEKFCWDSKSTQMMLDEYEKRIDEFNDSSLKKKHLWEEVSNVFLQHGYCVDGDYISRKMQQMKMRYKTIVDKKYTNQTRWKYFEYFENILKKDKSLADHVAEIPNISSASQDSRKFHWQHKSTQMMLDEYKIRVHKFRNPKIEKRTLWEDIAYVMRQHGYCVNGDSLDRKMRNMKHTYKLLLENLNNKKPRWVYFDIFQDIFNSDETYCDESSTQDYSVDNTESRAITSKVNQTFQWQTESVLLMLNEYKKRIDKFRSRTIPKKPLWEEISNIMNEHGYDVDGDTIHAKMRFMKLRYKINLDNPRYRNDNKKPKWKFFEIFDKLFNNDFGVMYSTNAEVCSTQEHEPSTSQGEFSPDMIETGVLTSLENENEIQQQIPTHDKKVHTKHKVFTCNVCDEKFLAKQNLQTHMYTHSVAKPYMCELCGKSYVAKISLIEHMRSHTGEKPYVCDTCGKSYTTKSNFKKHKMIHTGEKPYFCDTCGKRFIQQGDMMKHKRIHTGEKPYVCTFCNRAFRNSSALIEHKRTHTREEHYTCDICNTTFARKYDAKRHKLKKHNIQELVSQ